MTDNYYSCPVHNQPKPSLACKGGENETKRKMVMKRPTDGLMNLTEREHNERTNK